MNPSTSQKTTITVLGAGSWGTALSSVLAKNGHRVLLWDKNPELLQGIKLTGKNPKYLKNISLPKGIDCISDIQSAVEGADTILIVIPSHGFTQIIQNIKPYLTPKHRLIWGTKGLEPHTASFLSQVVERELNPHVPYGILSGPSFAAEVANGLPTAVTIAAKDINLAKNLADIFHNEFFRVYLTQDITGVQLGGVVKNVLAVAAGISDGMKLGSNARAALITRGLAEMMRLGEALGAKRETLMGLAGCGDVILTCTDDQSRNKRFGLLLAEGLMEEQALKQIGQVVEAVYNVEQLCHLAKEKQIELPISEQVFRIMKLGVSPKETVAVLFARSLKNE